jgi:hypothetical protein
MNYSRRPPSHDWSPRSAAASISASSPSCSPSSAGDSTLAGPMPCLMRYVRRFRTLRPRCSRRCRWSASPTIRHVSRARQPRRAARLAVDSPRRRGIGHDQRDRADIRTGRSVPRGTRPAQRRPRPPMRLVARHRNDVHRQPSAPELCGVSKTQPGRRRPQLTLVEGQRAPALCRLGARAAAGLGRSRMGRRGSAASPRWSADQRHHR